MSTTDFDSVVKNVVAETKEEEIRLAATEIEAQKEGCALNRNRPLNMIAYEDQK